MAVHKLKINESFEFILEQNSSDYKIAVLSYVAYSNKLSIGIVRGHLESKYALWHLLL